MTGITVVMETLSADSLGDVRQTEGVMPNGRQIKKDTLSKKGEL